MKVILGSVEYEVEEVKDLKDNNKTQDKLNGLISADSLVIKLESDRPLTGKRITLIHEIIHGILCQSGRSKHIEAEVDALSYGLYDFIHKNPEIIDYITGKTNEKPKWIWNRETSNGLFRQAKRRWS